jgi:hypothetical protein
LQQHCLASFQDSKRGTDLVLALKIILGDKLLQIIDMLPFEAPNLFRSEKNMHHSSEFYTNPTLHSHHVKILLKLGDIVFEVCSGKKFLAMS